MPNMFELQMNSERKIDIHIKEFFVWCLRKSFFNSVWDSFEVTMKGQNTEKFDFIVYWRL